MNTESKKVVTLRLDGQRFGIPVEYVCDVLRDQNIAPVPRAPQEVAGSINLRGRIVTVLDLRRQLGISGASVHPPMFVVVDYQGEYFSLMVDKVNEVLDLPDNGIEPCPANLPAQWKMLALGICQMEEDLLVIIDIRALLAE